MNDTEFCRQPARIVDIVAESEGLSFNMMSEAKVGALLAVLAASKPGAVFLNWAPARATGRRGFWRG
jgi:hypothetical protein